MKRWQVTGACDSKFPYESRRQDTGSQIPLPLHPASAVVRVDARCHSSKAPCPQAPHHSGHVQGQALPSGLTVGDTGNEDINKLKMKLWLWPHPQGHPSVHILGPTPWPRQETGGCRFN